MNDDLLSFYNGELSFLRDLGAEFAAKYPRVAGRLQLESDRCEDPHVERLLEGFAFLTARVRKKIDDELPEITEALLGVLYPHFLRPVPSTSIVQLRLNPEGSRSTTGARVARGSRLNSKPIGGSPCSFQTSYDTMLWPLEVTSANLDPDRVVFAGKPPEAVALLQLTLACTGGLTFAKLSSLDSLRIFLDGEAPIAYGLYELLFNDTCRVLVRGETTEGKVETITLPHDALRPVGFGLDEGLFPYPSRSFPGYRLLQEYFAFPEKFLFLDLHGLSALSARKFAGSVSVFFFLNASPRNDLLVGPDNFRLGCTPIVNLFPLVCEPIILDQTRTEYRVIPDVHRPTATEIYSIDDVVSTGAFLSEPTRYEPFYAMRHGMAPQSQAYWYATRRESARKDDAGTEVSLAFVDPKFNPRVPAVDAVTVRATCTNRDLPSKLPFGGDQAELEMEAQAPINRIRLLRKPTRSLRPPLGRALQWRLISHLALNHLSLADDEQGLESFREILRIYDFADSAVTRHQIGGVTKVSHRRAAGRTGRRIGNTVCLGVEVTVEFDESAFVGSGAFLLASVLERFLALFASINSFSQLVARTNRREGILKRWPPRSGERSLL